MNLQELQQLAHATAVDRGWHECDEIELPLPLTIIQRWLFAIARALGCKPTARQKLAWLALVTDELDEADCEHKDFFLVDGKPCGVATEYADAMVRVADASSAIGYQLEPATESTEPIHRARTTLVDTIRTGRDTFKNWSELYHAIREDAVMRVGAPRLAHAIEEKMKYNRHREYRHGGKLA